ncbi:ABC-type protease exporter, ATP-binding component PrtD/AprD [Burkholderiales bacterium 8X]|nr:ABC-type protease exporter, ATP-binding component PrtD/AprD [Burkholderiales bacterium 8X]
MLAPNSPPIGMRFADARPTTSSTIWPAPAELAGSLVASTVVHLLLLVPTLVTLQIYDRVLTSRSHETLLMLLVAAALSLVGWWVVETARVRWHAARAAGLDAHLTDALMPLIVGTQAGQSGDMAQQLWRDIATLRGFVGGPAMLAVIDLPWCLVYLCLVAAFHPMLGIVALVGMLLLVALAWLADWRLRRISAEAEHAQSRAQDKSSEIATFAEVLQAHGQQIHVCASLGRIRSTASDLRLAAELPGHNLKNFGKLARHVLQLAMLAVGAWLVLRGEATGGVMIAGSILLGKALMPLEVLIGSWKHQLETRKALKRLRQAAAAQVQLAKDQPQTRLPSSRGGLQVVQLAVRHAANEAAILHNLGFELPCGAALAVLGGSGSGKSTLARVLAGVLPATHGEARLDGAAIEQYEQESRGRSTGYLPQEVMLHSGTIAHNIARLWQPRDALTAEQSEAVIAAARRAGAHDLITSLPNGYDTMLGNARDTRVLSGGQRQRIGLARALYATPGAARPSLVVLDEPNSQLDAEGDAALERCLQLLGQERTTVVFITHRPQLIEMASHVLVLRAGTVEQFGPREQVRQWMARRNEARSAAAPRASVEQEAVR